MNVIIPCSQNEFINNATEINGYFQAKKSIAFVNNTKRLVALLELYFKTLLYYLQNSNQKYIVSIKPKSFVIKLNGRDENGNPKVLDLAEAGHALIKNVYSDLNLCIDQFYFEKLQEVIIAVLDTKSIPTAHKLLLLNQESETFGIVGDRIMHLISDDIARKSISKRIDFIYSFLKLPDNEVLIKDKDKLYEVYQHHLRNYLRNCIARNHFIDGLKFIYNEIERFDSIDPQVELDNNKLVFILLNTLCSYNNLYQIETKEKITEIIDDYKQFLDNEKSKFIQAGLNFNPNNFDITNLQIELVDSMFEGIELDTIATQIHFVIKAKTKKEHTNFELEGLNIQISELKNLFDDPIFSFLDSSNIQINGMPVSIFSDAIGNISESVLISFNLSSFFHPDFELVEGKVVYKDFVLENATHGGKYYPHKDYIVEKILLLSQIKDLPITLKKEEINSNFISNYFVSYYSHNKLLYHKVFTITNFNSYYLAKNRYFESFNNINFTNSNDIQEFIWNFEILNQKHFLDFSILLLEKTVKKSIELGGLYSLFWDDKVPKGEVDAQKLIYSIIRFIAEMKGVSISRETVSSNGSLDFFFQYTKENKSLRICVELKNAHHDKIENGIVSQLPEYIKDTGNNDGIYLVLWYKDKEFDKPTKYNTIPDLLNELRSSVPKNFRISPLIIDCSRFKTTPSKK